MSRRSHRRQLLCRPCWALETTVTLGHGATELGDLIPHVTSQVEFPTLKNKRTHLSGFLRRRLVSVRFRALWYGLWMAMSPRALTGYEDPFPPPAEQVWRQDVCECGRSLVTDTFLPSSEAPLFPAQSTSVRTSVWFSISLFVTRLYSQNFTGHHKQQCYVSCLQGRLTVRGGHMYCHPLQATTVVTTRLQNCLVSAMGQRSDLTLSASADSQPM